MLRQFNRLRRAPDGLNPVAMGWSMILGVVLPVSIMTLVILLFSAVLGLCGIDPSVFIVICFHQMASALVPLVETLSVIWLAYTTIYFAIAIVAAVAIRGLHAALLARIHAGDSLLNTQGRILRVWQHVTVLSLVLIQKYIQSDFQRAFSGSGNLPYVSSGWRPGVNPQLA